MLSTLIGETKRALSGFLFCEENCEVVVQWLKKEYARDRTAAAIEQLHRKAEEAQTKEVTSSVERKLLDELTATMMQLTSNGQSLNHRVLSRLFRKFDAIQEKALAERVKLQSLEEQNWSKFQQSVEVIVKS